MNSETVLQAVRDFPGCRMRDVLEALNIPQTDRDSEQAVGLIMGQLSDWGLITQERGGWYAPPDSYATVQAAKRQAKADARIENARARAALRDQTTAANRAARNGQLEARRLEQAQRHAANRERFFSLTKGMTLATIAAFAGRSVSAAQQWREGRSPVPDYAIEALEAAHKKPGFSEAPAADLL